jgi:hypothetical protein
MGEPHFSQVYSVGLAVRTGLPSFVKVHRDLALGVTAAPQEGPARADALEHVLAARGALVLRLDRLGPFGLALGGLDVLAALLEAGTADELALGLLAERFHQRPAALGAHLARLDPAL